MKKSLWTILIITSTLSLQGPPISKSLTKEYEKRLNKQIKEEFFTNSEFSPSVFYEAITFIGIQNPDIVFRQSVLETGWFKSQSFLKYHNPFGMKQPVHRETYAVGTKMGHGEFRHWYEAVKDYKLWQDYWIKQELDAENYYSFLDQLPYAEAPNYTRILKTINIDAILEPPVS